MVEIVKSIAAVVATCSEFTAVVVIVIGAVQSVTAAVREFLPAKTPMLHL